MKAVKVLCLLALGLAVSLGLAQAEVPSASPADAVTIKPYVHKPLLGAFQAAVRMGHLDKVPPQLDLQAVVQLLYSQCPDGRPIAAYSLGEIGDPRAYGALVGQLSHEDGHLRAAAARALGKIGDPRAVPYLANLLLDRSQPLCVRWDALAALRMIGGRGAAAALRQTAVAESGHLQREASRSLARLP